MNWFTKEFEYFFRLLRLC